MRKIAIGDIHGCAKTFKKLLKKINLGIHDELIILGDMIDRGPDSKGVFDQIIAIKDAGHRVVLLQGNHEELMLNAHIDSFVMDRFLNAGGRKTLASFGIKRLADLDAKYWQLLVTMKDYYESEGYIFVHGGLNFGLKNPFEAVRDMRWIRDWHSEINYDWLAGRVIIHGHSPRTIEIIKLMHDRLAQKRVLDIDSGCVYGKGVGQGFLTAYDTEAKELIFQENVE